VALSQENDAQFRSHYSLTVQHGLPGLATLDGTEWEIRLMPMGAESAAGIQQDQLAFTHNQVSSSALTVQQFPPSNYTLTPQPNGVLLWETMQTSPHGEVVCWRGEWQGTTMRGVTTRQPAGKAPENFTFVGTVRMSVARSEI